MVQVASAGIWRVKTRRDSGHGEVECRHVVVVLQGLLALWVSSGAPRWATVLNLCGIVSCRCGLRSYPAGTSTLGSWAGLVWYWDDWVVPGFFSHDVSGDSEVMHFLETGATVTGHRTCECWTIAQRFEEMRVDPR